MTLRLPAAMVLLASMVLVLEASPPQKEVTAVRYWSLADTTRIAIELTGDVRVRSDRVQNPDRIFFDFVGARPAIEGHRLYSSEVGDKLLKRIRVAETSPGITRVVLDLENAADFTISRLDNPSRLMIELRSPHAMAEPEQVVRLNVPVPVPAPVLEPPKQELIPVRRAPEPMREPPQRPVALQPVSIADPPALKPDIQKTARLNVKIVSNPKISSNPNVVTLPEPPSALPPSTVAVDDHLAAAAPVREAPERIIPRPANITGDGERSLIRALGLKINRVVIDPGHGGTDQGTVGHRGLMEKDLVLDVARRLGKLIEERMGSEVIYTRADDTFIPLQARTELANEKKADLFLSIHANSSPHPKVGGIEVYYLNFTHSTDALD